MANFLGKIEKVGLREVWPHEALDFTKWLAKEKNLALLSQAVGIELELVAYRRFKAGSRVSPGFPLMNLESR